MKTQQQTGLWVFVAVVLALIVGVVSYFTLIGPQLDTASAARENAQITRDENELLTLQIQRMRSLEQEVPEWREQVARISLDLPPRPDQPELERLLVDRLERAGLPLVDTSTGRPTTIDPLTLADAIPPTVETAEPTPTPSPSPEPAAEGDEELDTDGASGGTAGGTTEAPAVPEAPFTGLLGMPVTINTEGDPGRVLDFMKSMETQLARFFTVTGVTVTKATVTEATPGRPALNEQQWTVQITGLVFSLLDENRSFVEDEEGELPEYAPGARVDNAFAPLPGTEEGGG